MHYLRHENKAHTKQGMIMSWDMCNYLRELKTMKKSCFDYIKLKDQLSFKTNFKKWTNTPEEKRLIHGTKHSQDNQLQSLELPCIIS